MIVEKVTILAHTNNFYEVTVLDQTGRLIPCKAITIKMDSENGIRAELEISEMIDATIINAIVSECHEEKHWNSVVDAANKLRAKLDGKPKELKVGFPLSYAGILNAYREGDIDFSEAVSELEKVCNKAHFLALATDPPW